jgi:hypothetical protein
MSMIEQINIETKYNWFDPNHQNYSPIWAVFAQRAVKMSDKVYVERGDNTCALLDNAAALRELAGEFVIGNKPHHTGIVVTESHCKEYLQHRIPSMDGPGFWPNDHIHDYQFEGKRYRNMYRDCRVRGGDPRNCEGLLRVIKRNLLAHDDWETADWDELLKQCNTRTQLGWVMQWMAARYQKPTHTPMTALAIFSGYGGGKNTLLTALKGSIGVEWVGTWNQDDFEKGWTDFLCNALFMCVDEIDQGERSKFYKRMKDLIGNNIMKVNKRNLGSLDMPNVMSMIMFGNDAMNSMTLKDNDRRVTVFEGLNSKTLAEHTEWTDNVAQKWAPTEMGAGFAEKVMYPAFGELLATVEVDWAYIRKPLSTQAKNNIIAASKTGIELLIDELNNCVGSTAEDRLVDWVNNSSFKPWREEQDKDKIIKITDLKNLLASASNMHNESKMMERLKEAGYDLYPDALGKNRTINSKSQRALKLGSW